MRSWGEGGARCDFLCDHELRRCRRFATGGKCVDAAALDATRQPGLHTHPRANGVSTSPAGDQRRIRCRIRATAPANSPLRVARAV